MIKTKNKAKKLLGLDKLGQRIAHAQKYFAKQRRARAEKSFQRAMMQLLT